MRILFRTTSIQPTSTQQYHDQILAQVCTNNPRKDLSTNTTRSLKPTTCPPPTPDVHMVTWMCSKTPMNNELLIRPRGHNTTSAVRLEHARLGNIRRNPQTIFWDCSDMCVVCSCQLNEPRNLRNPNSRGPLLPHNGLTPRTHQAFATICFG